MTRRGESRAQNGDGQSTSPLGASDPPYLKSQGDDRLPADEQRGQTGADKSGQTQPLGDARGPHETASAPVLLQLDEHTQPIELSAESIDEAECVLTTCIGIKHPTTGLQRYVGPGRVTLPRADIVRLRALTHRVVADA